MVTKIVAKMVAKEALAQSKSPPIAAFSFVFTEKDYERLLALDVPARTS